MYKSPLTLLTIFFVLIDLGNALYGSSSPVLQLTPTNFKSKVLNSNGVVFVEFFAPWCGHCKSLTPTWEKVASALKGVATVAAIDADAHKSVSQDYGVRGFPTIKVFVPGKPPVDYQGARDAKSITKFATQQIKALLKDRLEGKTSGTKTSEKKSEPSASVELNASNFDELVIGSKELWIVEFFAPWCGHCKKLAPEWKKAAKKLKGKVKLGHVDCDAEKSIQSRFQVKGFPTILVFGADKSKPLSYDGARSASAIESFALEQLDSNTGPVEVTELTGPDVMEEKCGTAAICFVSFLPDILDSKAEGRNKYINMLLSVAEKFKKDPNRMKTPQEIEVPVLTTTKNQNAAVLVIKSDVAQERQMVKIKPSSDSSSYLLQRLSLSKDKEQLKHSTMSAKEKESQRRQLEGFNSFVWVAAGKQPDLEKRVGVGGYGYPAMVALNAKKGAFAPLKSGFEVKHLKEFVEEAKVGGKGNLPIDGTLEIVKTEAWDGKDGEVIDADEFSLEELMGDDDASTVASS